MTHPFDTNPPHSKKGGPVTHHDATDFSLVLDQVHHRVTTVEPIARDLNRHLTDLLGPCPVADSNNQQVGSWVRIVQDDDGNFLLQLPVLPLSHALRVSSALATLSQQLSFSDVRTSLPSVFHCHLPFFPEWGTTPVSGHVSVVPQ
jgi:hypothetical protein